MKKPGFGMRVVISHLMCLILFCFLLTAAGMLNQVQAQSFSAADGYAEFISRAPLLEFKGTSDHLHGLIDLDKDMVDFYLDLNTIDTGIRLRNRHMRDSYLETDRCPYAEFTGKLTTTFDPDLHEEQQVVVAGAFTIHCVEQPMVGTGTITPTERGLQLNASWVVGLDDHNIDRPRVVFYELADEQQVNITIFLAHTP